MSKEQNTAEYQKEYYRRRMKQDPQWRGKRRKSSLEYYHKRCKNDPDFLKNRAADARALRASVKTEETARAA